jgi:hypothetical protein
VNELESLVRLLPLLIPLFLIEIGLMIVALMDVVRRERVRGGNKVVWILVIVLISMIGPIVYLLFGREEVPLDSDQD